MITINLEKLNASPDSIDLHDSVLLNMLIDKSTLILRFEVLEIGIGCNDKVFDGEVDRGYIIDQVFTGVNIKSMFWSSDHDFVDADVMDHKIVSKNTMNLCTLDDGRNISIIEFSFKKAKWIPLREVSNSEVDELDSEFCDRTFKSLLYNLYTPGFLYSQETEKIIREEVLPKLGYIRYDSTNIGEISEYISHELEGPLADKAAKEKLSKKEQAKLDGYAKAVTEITTRIDFK